MKTAARGGSTWTPDKHQLTALKYMISRPAAGLLLDPGFGKTAVTLHAFEILKQAKHADLLIVVAKLRIVTSTWPNEIGKWGLNLTHAVLHGPKREAAIRDHRHYDCFFTNYESLDWLVNRLGLLEGRKIMLVFDESSKLKDTRTGRFKAAKKLAMRIMRRHVLTGSPMPQSLMDMFGQTFILDLGESFSPYITHFRNEYFIPSGYMGYEWVPQEDAEERIFTKLKPLMLRMPPGVIKMPKVNIGGPLDRYIALPPAARKVYDQLEKTYVADVKSGIVTAANAAVASNKLRQVVGGFVYGLNNAVNKIHDEKLEDLAELLDELQGSPALIAYQYKPELEALLKRWPKTPYIGAGVSTKVADKIVDDFNAGKLPFIFAHPQSAAHGLNLQESCRTVIWYSLTWSLEDYEQFIQRVWRRGQKHNVNVYRILATNTVDDLLIKTLDRKDRNQQRLLQALELKYEKEGNDQARDSKGRKESEVEALFKAYGGGEARRPATAAVRRKKAVATKNRGGSKGGVRGSRRG